MNKKRVFKILKWFFGILLGIIVLISASVYYFKDEIIGIVLEEVNAHLKAKVKVEKVDLAFWSSFPNLSVDFNKVFIKDSYEEATEKDTLFYSDKIRLKFNPLDIWRENYKLKQIEVLPGTLQLKIDKNGKNNFDIFKETADTVETAFAFDLQKLYINNLRFSYDDKVINQRYATDLLTTELEGKFTEKVFTMHAVSSQIVRETRSGQINFVSNKKAKININIEINREKGTIIIPKTNVYLANLPFQFSGNVNPSTMKFTIESNNLALVDVVNNISLQEIDYIKKYSGSGNVDFSLVVDENRLDEIAPSIDCKFNVSNGKLIEPTQNIQVNNLSLKGEFSSKNGAGNEYLSLEDIRFTNTTGPFSGNIRISEFNAPLFQGNANGNIDLAIAHSLFHIPMVEKMNGNMNINADFIVKMLEADEEIGTNFNIIKSEGAVELTNCSVQLKDDQRNFHSINGKITLNNNDVNVAGLGVQLQSSDLLLNGTFTNLIGYFRGDGLLQATMDVRSNKIVVEDLATTSKEEQIQTQAPRSYMLPQQIDGKLALSIGQLSYDHHHFEKINGNLSLTEHTLRFEGINFVTSGAAVNGSILIREQSEEFFQTSSTLSTANVQLKQLMKDWNNFNQQVITADNIFGKATAQLQLDAPFDLRTGIQMKNVKSNIYLKIENGQLKNVGAFKDIIQSANNSSSAKLVIGANNIKTFGEKLSDLRFETLENQITIQNGVITVPEMKIQSSALNIVASGTHTIEQKIDYRFAFRLRDLKAAKDTEFGEVVDDKTGLIVYLRMYGDLSNPQFSWDKEAKAEARKEYNEQEKQTLKSMLKSEFGMFKKDSTVQKYQEQKKPKEVIEVQYGNDAKSEEPKETPQKEPKKNKFLDKLKNGEEKKKVEVEFE